jgi:hypothetical protein
MTTVSPVSLEHLEAIELSLPGSPKQIPTIATLAELEQIRSGWIEQAHAEKIPEKLFDIGFYLGGPMKLLVHRSNGVYRAWQDADSHIEIHVSQRIKTRNVPASAWNIVRTVYATVDNNIVLIWSWAYTGQDEKDPAMPADATATAGLYVPGKWTARALALSPKAEKARIGIAMTATVAKRDELAGELLVGMEV